MINCTCFKCPACPTLIVARHAGKRRAPPRRGHPKMQCPVCHTRFRADPDKVKLYKISTTAFYIGYCPEDKAELIQE
jgi:hypothetical protein